MPSRILTAIGTRRRAGLSREIALLGVLKNVERRAIFIESEIFTPAIFLFAIPIRAVWPRGVYLYVA